MRRQASLSTVQTGQPAISLDIHPTAPVFAGATNNIENHTNVHCLLFSLDCWSADIGAQPGRGTEGCRIREQVNSDVILWWKFDGIGEYENHIRHVNMCLYLNSNVLHYLHVNVFPWQDIEPDSLP